MWAIRRRPRTRQRRGWAVCRATSHLSAHCCSLTLQRTCESMRTNRHKFQQLPLIRFKSFPHIFVLFSSYKKYVFLDPLAGAVTKTHTTLEKEKEEKPFDAPLSITKREQLERQVCSPILAQKNHTVKGLVLTRLMTKSSLSYRQQKVISMCQTWARCLRLMCRPTCRTCRA